MYILDLGIESFNVSTLVDLKRIVFHSMLNLFLTGDEDFLILACDGLWDVVKPEEAVQCVVQYLANGGERSSVAKLLVDSAKNGGSNDNISVVVVFLDAHKRDVPVRAITDNVANIVLTDVEQHVSFDENVVNFTENGTNENSNSKNTEETSPVPSPELSPKSSKTLLSSEVEGNTFGVES